MESSQALTPGSKTVTVQAKGFLRQTLTAHIVGDETTRLAVTLKRPQFGKLHIKAPPRGWSDVYHGGKKNLFDAAWL